MHVSLPLPRLLPLVLFFAASSLTAQDARSARIQGVVFDSLSGKPLAGAVVSIVQLSPAPQQFLVATTNGDGRYQLDSLMAGRYSIGVSTAFLDSLEIALPLREITLGPAEQARSDFATPSRGTLVMAACPGIALPKGRGAILGRVLDAESDRPLGAATIAVRWADVGLDRATMRPRTIEHQAAAVTDSLGQYRLCGVPTDVYVTLQIQQDGRAGIPLRVTASDAAGVVVQNLSLSARSAMAIAPDTETLPAAHAVDTTATQLTGTASVAGVVRDSDGRPLADAQVRVLDAVGSARTDSTGEFSLGNQPAGTQLLEVRRVGYLVGQQPAELRAGRTVRQDILMSRIVTLDSIRIIAQRTRIEEFERRAGLNTAAAKILAESAIEKLHVNSVGDIFRYGRILGFQVVGDGLDARVRSTRGVASFDMNCNANVVIDGMQHQEIDLVRPGDIAGIEVYRGASGAPPEYDSSCGVILVWTKR